jgi:hypothetical protein
LVVALVVAVVVAVVAAVVVAVVVKSNLCQSSDVVNTFLLLMKRFSFLLLHKNIIFFWLYIQISCANK